MWKIATAMVAGVRGWPWKLLRLEVRGNSRANFRGLPGTSGDFRGDCRVVEAIAANGRGNRPGSFHENCRGSCRGLPSVAIAGTTEFATD